MPDDNEQKVHHEGGIIVDSSLEGSQEGLDINNEGREYSEERRAFFEGALNVEKDAMEAFIAEVSRDGEVGSEDGEIGSEAVAEMTALVADAEKISKTWYQILGDILARTREALQNLQEKRRAKALQIKDNPKIWREIDRRTDKIRSTLEKLQKLDKEFSIPPELEKDLRSLLQDYNAFNKKKDVYYYYEERYSGNLGREYLHRTTTQFIENFIQHGEMERALSLWKVVPECNVPAAEALIDVIYKKYEACTSDTIPVKYSEAERRMQEAVYEKYGEDILADFERFPDLQMVYLKEYAGDKKSRHLHQEALVPKLIAMPNRHSFLQKVIFYHENWENEHGEADLARMENFRQFLGPENRRALFDIFLFKYADVGKLLSNYPKQFFQEELENLTVEERAFIVDGLISELKFNGCRTGIFSRFLEFIKLTREEQQKIYKAVGSKPSEYEKFITRLIDYPSALLLNSPILLGYERTTPDEPKLGNDVTDLLDFLIGEKKDDLLCQTVKNFARCGTFRLKRQIDKAVGYLVELNSPEAIKTFLDDYVYNYIYLNLTNDQVKFYFTTKLLEYCRDAEQLPSPFFHNRLRITEKDYVHFLDFAPVHQNMYLEILFSRGDERDFRSLCSAFDELAPEQEKRFLDEVIKKGNDRTYAIVFKLLKNSPRVETSTDPRTRLLGVFAQKAPFVEDGYHIGSVVTHYLDVYQNASLEDIENYFEQLKIEARTLIGIDVPMEVRDKPEYKYLVAGVFPKGNYSDYDKNLACGDQLGHVKKYEFNQNGYGTEMSGLLGYRLQSEENADNIKLFQSYESRFKEISDFVASRGPDNEALQKVFNEKVEILFDDHVLTQFRGIGELNIKEKMLVLFIGESLRQEQSKEYIPRREILDLVVEYKYAYCENLEAYVQQSAHDVQQYSDEVSQRFSLWQQLSTIYGENLKHVLQHNIFEELADNGKNYDKIIDAFGVSFQQMADHFQLSSRETKSIENIFNKKLITSEERYSLVIEKLADLLGPQLKLKGDEDKQRNQQTQYDADRAQFVTVLEGILSPHAENLDMDTVASILEKSFLIHPRQLARFENTFDNDQIPLEDTVVKEKLKESKYKVLIKQTLEIFGSNIQFRNDDDRENFESAVQKLLATQKFHIDKQKFFALIPKLRTLRNQYRFGVNAKLEELFSLDINAISREIAKFEEITEVEAKETQMNGPKEKEVKKSAKKRRIRSYITKTQETANARMGAYLCIAGDPGMWTNENYFEAVDQDEETGRCVGLTMFLDIKSTDGKRYLWFGPNPFESVLTQVSSEKYFEHQYAVAVDLAEKNGFDGIVVPPEDGQILGQCTNRGGKYPDLIKQRRLRGKDNNLKIVNFGSTHTLGKYGNSPYSYQSGALVWEKAA